MRQGYVRMSLLLLSQRSQSVWTHEVNYLTGSGRQPLCYSNEAASGLGAYRYPYSGDSSGVASAFCVRERWGEPGRVSAPSSAQSGSRHAVTTHMIPIQYRDVGGQVNVRARPRIDVNACNASRHVRKSSLLHSSSRLFECSVTLRSFRWRRCLFLRRLPLVRQ